MPSHKKKCLGAEQTMTLTAIELVEIETEGNGNVKAIHWKLLTTWPVASPEEAIRMVRWYANRWNIEVFFPRPENRLPGGETAIRQHSDPAADRCG